MIAILDYQAGNLTSVLRALAAVGVAAEITADPEVIRRSRRIIFPGVGAAGAAMRALEARGLDQALKEVLARGDPVLGICIGCQIILKSSAENKTACLGVMPGRVKAFPQPLRDRDGTRLKVPHMGWNGVQVSQAHPVLEGLAPGAEFYFVHGYYPQPARQSDVLGWTDYGLRFASIIGRDNLIAVQFHTEKSGRPGLNILENFASWRP